MGSYGLSARAPHRCSGKPIEYVWNTGQLFLKTREALAADRTIVLEPYHPGVLESRSEPVGPAQASTTGSRDADGHR
jgi:hypothetical protein